MHDIEWTMRVLEIRKEPHWISEEEIVKLGGDPAKKDAESILGLTDSFFLKIYNKTDAEAKLQVGICISHDKK
jgi:hypothetical protein